MPGLAEIFSEITGHAPSPIVVCSVTDSIVSGLWGLVEFRLFDRGFVYYVADAGTGDDESLPVLGAWEPAANEDARRECLIRTYVREWERCGLPPAMGQWAAGDAGLFHQAILGVLNAEPEEWANVFVRLREAPQIKTKDTQMIQTVSRFHSIEETKGREVLNLVYAEINDRLLVRLQGDEGQILTSFYVWCIAQGGLYP